MHHYSIGEELVSNRRHRLERQAENWRARGLKPRRRIRRRDDDA